MCGSYRMPQAEQLLLRLDREPLGNVTVGVTPFSGDAGLTVKSGAARTVAARTCRSRRQPLMRPMFSSFRITCCAQ